MIDHCKWAKAVTVSGSHVKVYQRVISVEEGYNNQEDLIA